MSQGKPFMRAQSARAAATAYVAAGWRIVPVPAKSKRPIDEDWPKRVYTPDHIVGNVGVMLGKVSGDLVDADLDSHWGLKLASYYLPDTVRFGRQGKPDSHWLFRCAGLRSRKFTFARGDRIELIELRATNATNDNGAQTVFPGSIHESGERVEWSDDALDEVTTIERGDLLWRMTRLATAAVIAEEMREGNQRNNQARAWAGGLLQKHWTADEVRELFSAVYDAHQTDAAQRAKDLGGVERTILAYETGTSITAFGSLVNDGIVAPAIVRRVEHLCRTPDTLAAELKMAGTVAGKDTAERLIREAQNTDKLGQIQDEIAAAVIARDAAAVLEIDAGVWNTVPFTFFDVEREPEPLAFVWGPIAAGKVSAIVAYAYTAKTPFALDLGICVAQGEPFNGSATQRRRVLYVASEGARNTRRKAQRIARAHGTTLAALGDWFQVVASPSGWLNAESAEALCVVCRAEQIGMVILDTYGSALDGNVDRNASAFSDALKQLGDESDETGIVFIVLLHERKEKREGSNALARIDGHNSVAGALQAAIELSRPNAEDKHLIKVECIRAPDEEFEPFMIRWADVQQPGPPPAFGTPPRPHDWGLIANPSDGTPTPQAMAKAAQAQATIVQQAKAEISNYVKEHPLCLWRDLKENVKAKEAIARDARIALVTAGVLLEITDRQFRRYKIK